jgi:hypothetical protein
MPRKLRFGERVYHRGREQHGTYIGPAGKDTCLVQFDDGTVSVPVDLIKRVSRTAPAPHHR